MKDFCRVKFDGLNKFYLDENNNIHRLYGQAIENYKQHIYFINNLCYMCFYIPIPHLSIYKNIINIIPEYEKYIKQNIKDLIKEYNPKITLHSYFTKEQINNLPDWLKDLIIL